MNRKEAMRQTHMFDTLQSLGFTQNEAESLRRISMTLRRWHELECGTGEGQVTRSIERDGDEPDSKPFMRVQAPTTHGWHDTRYPIQDRETGARKRLAKILAVRNARLKEPNRFMSDPVSAYIQTDPRGAALYILRPGDVPEGYTADCCYTRGICVY